MIFLDASVIIYLIEGNARLRSAVRSALSRLYRTDEPPAVAVSALGRLECRVRPLRDGNDALLARYDDFFTDPGLLVLPLDGAVLDRATRLRAHHRLRTPDALHAASLLAHDEQGTFVTGDRDFNRIPGLRVQTIDPENP